MRISGTYDVKSNQPREKENDLTQSHGRNHYTKTHS